MIWTLLFFINSIVLQSDPSFAKNIPVKGYKLVWCDEFNGNILDAGNWRHRSVGRRGDAMNSPDAVSVNGNGQLIISASQKADTVYAGMISTEGIFETRYGYFECRARLTKTNGIWPAFWLQSSLNSTNGIPEINGVEIDIFEYFRQANPTHVSHSLHWGGYAETHQVYGPFYSPLAETKDGFHLFGLEWTDSSYSTFVDGKLTFTGKDLISKVKQFMILSVEVNEQVAGPLDKALLPDSFVVDYIRVYKKDQ